MSIVAADLIACLPVNIVNDDAHLSGGMAEPVLAMRPGYTQWSAPAVMAVVSTSAGDVNDLLISGRTADGAYVQETITLTGLVEKLSTTVWERILDFQYNTIAAGAISIKQGSGGTLRYTIPIGEKGASALFKKSFSSSSILIRYDKIFFKNLHATITLQSSTVTLTADPDARIRMGVHTSYNDSAGIANRLTAPAGITFVDDSVAQNLPLSGAFAAGSKIGVWLEENLPAGDGPHKSTFTIQLSGTTI